MDVKDDSLHTESIVEFSYLIAYIWAINECVTKRELGRLKSYSKNYLKWLAKTADYLSIDIIDATLLALSFFEEFASERNMSIAISTEAMLWGIALMQTDLNRMTQ